MTAQVYVDGLYVGVVDDLRRTVPGRPLDAGPHRVELRADGYAPSSRDIRIDPGEATSSRVTMTHVLPSRLGTLSASAIFHLSRLNPAPRMTPVYTSDPALPRRPQDSVPACPLRL